MRPAHHTKHGAGALRLQPFHPPITTRPFPAPLWAPRLHRHSLRSALPLPRRCLRPEGADGGAAQAPRFELRRSPWKRSPWQGCPWPAKQRSRRGPAAGTPVSAPGAARPGMPFNPRHSAQPSLQGNRPWRAQAGSRSKAAERIRPERGAALRQRRPCPAGGRPEQGTGAVSPRCTGATWGPPAAPRPTRPGPAEERLPRGNGETGRGQGNHERLEQRP